MELNQHQLEELRQLCEQYLSGLITDRELANKFVMIMTGAA